MMNEGNATELVVRLYTGSDDTDGSMIEYRVEAQSWADAEYHIDSYKEEFDRRLNGKSEFGTLSVGSCATMSWFKDDKNFIVDCWCWESINF
jgi:hypothetical protein